MIPLFGIIYSHLTILFGVVAFWHHVFSFDYLVWLAYFLAVYILI